MPCTIIGGQILKQKCACLSKEYLRTASLEDEKCTPLRLRSSGRAEMIRVLKGRPCRSWQELWLCIVCILDTVHCFQYALIISTTLLYRLYASVILSTYAHYVASYLLAVLERERGRGSTQARNYADLTKIGNSYYTIKTCITSNVIQHLAQNSSNLSLTAINYACCVCNPVLSFESAAIILFTSMMIISKSSVSMASFHISKTTITFQVREKSSGSSPVYECTA